jgi:hypothetical protein
LVSNQQFNVKLFFCLTPLLPAFCYRLATLDPAVQWFLSALSPGSGKTAIQSTDLSVHSRGYCSDGFFTRSRFTSQVFFNYPKEPDIPADFFASLVFFP